MNIFKIDFIISFQSSFVTQLIMRSMQRSLVFNWKKFIFGSSLQVFFVLIFFL